MGEKSFIVKAHQTYPDLVSSVLVVIGIYFIYRLVFRSMRMWLRFAIVTIKVTLVMLFFITVIYLYNGWSFVNVWSLLRLLNNGSKLFASQANEAEPLNDAEAYLRYAREKFGDGNGDSNDYENVQKYIQEGFDYLKENVDLEDLGKNLKDVLGKFQ
ncbi:hypothetical protein KGF56_000218 [Candida oxycetoniae]|uniref:Uncharacterized protein n=1 Tax=Candida oxycetoniae TaxID=497107 RepID=A0AAI9WZZ2_9ASCO|nr:uncharacterized protein KGF56_000218 [Candida oxycetoniae]KAI3406926.1 hypothetical protein KGF56_000218 [Candida oxycetoniae]